MIFYHLYSLAGFLQIKFQPIYLVKHFGINSLIFLSEYIHLNFWINQIFILFKILIGFQNNFFGYFLNYFNT